jgi:hypothetical protein
MRRAGLVAFALALPTLALGSSWAFHVALHSRPPLLDQDTALQDRLPQAWIDRQVVRVSKVRDRREFWAFEKSNVRGTAIKLLETPELRGALFPGYSEAMFNDQELWRIYSTRDFSSTAWLPPLQSSASPGVLVYHSWLGCLDIFRRYGADVIVFGSSETFRSLVPAALSHKRVLFCTTTYSYPHQAEWLAREMARSDVPRASWVILGVSLWSLYQDHAGFQSAQAEKKQLWDRYLASRYGRFAGDFKASENFRPPTWDQLYLPNLSTLGKHRNRLHEAQDPATYFSRNPDATTDGVVSRASLSTPAGLSAFFSSFKPSFPLFQGLDESQCHDRGEDRSLRTAVQATHAIAEHTLLYVPPISPRIRERLPRCYLERFQRTLTSLAGEGTIVQAAQSEDYGLTDSDYFYAGDIDGLVKFDSVHTNFLGAMKVSRQVAARLLGGRP